jgi:hypothetical protein
MVGLWVDGKFDAEVHSLHAQPIRKSSAKLKLTHLGYCDAGQRRDSVPG